MFHFLLSLCKILFPCCSSDRLYSQKFENYIPISSTDHQDHHHQTCNAGDDTLIRTHDAPPPKITPIMSTSLAAIPITATPIDLNAELNTAHIQAQATRNHIENSTIVVVGNGASQGNKANSASGIYNSSGGGEGGDGDVVDLTTCTSAHEFMADEEFESYLSFWQNSRNDPPVP